VVSGVNVVAVNSDTGLERRATTDSQGHYVIADLPLTGAYSIRFSLTGFSGEQGGPLQLRAGETPVVNAVLKPEGSRSQLTVFGSAEGIRSDSPERGNRLDLAKLENTPILGRKLSNTPLVDSAVRPARGTGDLFLNNTLFVINGAGRRQTSFVLDGSTADDAWGRQAILTNVPLSAVQEISVLTDAFSAEYGRTSGGVINVNTRSGANTVHGDLWGLLRPSAIQAAAPLATQGTVDFLGQGSGSLSGPVVRDRTFFLLSGEYNSQDRDSTVNSPLAPQNFTGAFRQELGVARLDHRVGDNNTLNGRVFVDRFSDTNPADAVGGLSLPSTARTFRRAAYTAQLAETSVLSSAVVNDARVAFQIGSPITQFRPVQPGTQYVRPGLATEGESRYGNLQNHQWQFADTASIARGGHSLRIGGDALWSSSGGVGQEFGGGFVLGQFTLRPADRTLVASLTAANVQRYSQSFGNLSYKVREWLGSVFLQDNWRVRPDLSINLGARYERQDFTDDLLDFCPRIGFAYNLLGDSRTVFRGSYGLYYSQIRANLAAGYEIGGPTGIFSFSAAPGQLGFPNDLRPIASFPAGAVLPPRDITIRPGERDFLSRFFDAGKLRNYPEKLLNPRSQQLTFGVERELVSRWLLSTHYVHQRTTRIDRPLDVNAPVAFARTAAGQSRPAADADATRPVLPAPNGYRRIISTVNDGLAQYDGLQTNLDKRFSHGFSMLLSYTWSHTINTVEPDVPGQDPNDANILGRVERASSLLDQRHRASLSGWWQFTRNWAVGGATFLASGRPFNVTTGVDNNGDGSNADRPVVGGRQFGRNVGRGTPSYDVQTFVQRDFGFAADRVRVSIRAEGFNLLNHSNIVGRNGAWGDGEKPLPSFGQPIAGINSVDPGREFQFALRVRF
jgi:hypothetical protein